MDALTVDSVSLPYVMITFRFCFQVCVHMQYVACGFSLVLMHVGRNIGEFLKPMCKPSKLQPTVGLVH
jgi:hypothetical protein